MVAVMTAAASTTAGAGAEATHNEGKTVVVVTSTVEVSTVANVMAAATSPRGPGPPRAKLLPLPGSPPFIFSFI